jgi:iron complex outermembrane receptor protein
MKKSILLLPALLLGDSISLKEMVISSEKEGEIGIKKGMEISQRADLSEVLSQNIPEITLSRTSGVGNDVILRGLQRDNIAVVVDDSIIYGACPNRMDPAIMHISSSQVDDVEIKEGVFDVSQFGSLGGTIHVKNREPIEGFGSETSLYGSSNSERFSLQLEGGDEVLRGNIGYSYDRAEQYEDGDGKNFAERVESITPENSPVRYKENDLDAYTRQNWYGNLFYYFGDSKVKLGYFGDYAEAVLYPIFSMDAMEDTTDLFTLKYTSPLFSANLFQSTVSHDMSNEFRNSYEMMPRTHKVESKVSGVKLESHGFGIDYIKKSWDGNLYSKDKFLYSMIPDVETEDFAIFGEKRFERENFEISFGARADFVEIEAKDIENAKISYTKSSQTYSGFGANLFGRYYLRSDTSLFLGFGQSVRFPNGKELYMNKVVNGKEAIAGNPDLKETKNREVDFGFDSGNLSSKIFYSSLKDFIYAYNTGEGLGFQNIDASLWGFDLKYKRELFAGLTGKVGVAYQRGRKDEALAGQTDKDLAEIPPLKLMGSLRYEKSKFSGSLEFLAGGEPEIDSDNGEKELDSYFVTNFKGSYRFSKNLKANFGVDNIFDETYALNNSYIGRGVNSSDSDVFVLNEMGRNIFLNMGYEF